MQKNNHVFSLPSWFILFCFTDICNILVYGLWLLYLPAYSSRRNAGIYARIHIQKTCPSSKLPLQSFDSSTSAAVLQSYIKGTVFTCMGGNSVNNIFASLVSRILLKWKRLAPEEHIVSFLSRSIFKWATVYKRSDRNTQKLSSSEKKWQNFYKLYQFPVSPLMLLNLRLTDLFQKISPIKTNNHRLIHKTPQNVVFSNLTDSRLLTYWVRD